MKSIDSVRAKHETKLMSTLGVSGVAIGEKDGKPAILVLVDPANSGKIPKTLDGFPVVIQETGPIQIQKK